MKNTAITFVVVAIIAAAVAFTLGFAISSNNDNTVTFDQNYQDSNAIVVKVASGEEVQSPYAVRDGYTLVGWYYDKECTDIASFPCKIKGNTTFYARWSDKMISTIFNEDYLTGTESGRALSNSSQITSGSSIIKINGSEYNTLMVSDGGSFLILDLDTSDDRYSVVSLDTYDIMFSIPSKDLIKIRTAELGASGNEFIIAQYYDGYYMYDLKGNSVGPAANAPQSILSDSIFFNGSFYRFDSYGKLRVSFDLSGDTHIPDGGNGNTFYELVIMKASDKTYYCGANILNDKYEVIKFVKFENKAVLGACVTLSDNCYLIQYGIEGSSSEYTVIWEGTSYIIKSIYIDKDLDESDPQFKRFIVKSFDRQNTPGIDWDMYAHDTMSIAFVQVPGSDDQTQMVTISSNGKHVTAVDAIDDVKWSSITPMSTPYHYAVTVYTDDLIPIALTNLVDGSGHVPKIVLTDVTNANGVRYFIKNDDSMYNIYDINGNIIGNYSGYTYMGASHNLLFFEKDGDCYIFRDASMSKLCGGNDVLINDWGYAIGVTTIISGQPSTTYTYYTENGSIITSSAQKNNMTFLTDSGEYVLNIQTASGEYRLFELTA